MNAAQSDLYLTKYPEIIEAAHETKNLLCRVIPLIQNLPGQIELECRLGQIDAKETKDPTKQMNKFTPGVTKAVYEQCLQLVQTYPNWSQVTNPRWITDFFYNFPENHTRPGYPQQLAKVLGSSFRPATQIRTSVVYLDENFRKIQHIYKHSLGQLTFRYHKLGSTVPASSSKSTEQKQLKQNNEYDLRFAINWEEEVHDIPNFALPTMVRIKQRKSFYYTPDHFVKPIWSFDFTKTWFGKTKEEAELAQKQSESIYEIECECLDMKTYMDNNDHDELFLATSILLKMRDFIGIHTPYSFECFSGAGGNK
jgi:hypothetical protein